MKSIWNRFGVSNAPREAFLPGAGATLSRNPPGRGPTPRGSLGRNGVGRPRNEPPRTRLAASVRSETRGSCSSGLVAVRFVSGDQSGLDRKARPVGHLPQPEP